MALKHLTCVLLILFNFAKSVSVSEIENVKLLIKDMKYLEENLVNLTVVENLIKDVVQQNISKQCSDSIAEMITHVGSEVTRIFKYLDATGKLGSGLLLGNRFMLGSDDECHRLSARICTRSYSLNKTLLGNQSVNGDPSISFGICLSEDCDVEDITLLSDELFRLTGLSNALLPDTSSLSIGGGKFHCERNQNEKSSGVYGTLFLCIMLLLFAFFGTLADTLGGSNNLDSTKGSGYIPFKTEESLSSDNLKEEDSDKDNEEEDVVRGPPMSMLTVAGTQTSSSLHDFFVCFSIRRNASLIFRTNLPRGAIPSINGIRTISMFWIILCHTFVRFVQFSDNPESVISVLHRFTFLPIVNGSFAVDSFFLLSGLLVSYLTIRRLDAKGSIPWVKFYVHRFIRLTPTYMFVILFTIYIFPLFGSGPLWYTQKPLSDACKTYWWTNLLYINNFYPIQSEDGCISWTWYLANDMQFYAITPIIIIIINRLGWLGTLLSNGLLIIASIVITGVLSAYDGTPNDSKAILKGVVELTDTEYLNHIYIKPYCRIVPYLIGIILGYALYIKIALKRRYRSVWMMIGWCMAIVVALATVYGNWSSKKVDGTPMNLISFVCYNALTHLSWPCAVAYVIYACQCGYGGLVNDFLSWRAFTPLSRLTYSTYLIHLLIIRLYVGSVQTPLHYTDLVIAYLYVGFVAIAYSCAFVLALFVEYPLMNVEQFILKKIA